MDAFGEVYVVFVEYGGPLEGSTVNLLASSAVAVFRVQWLLTAQLIFYLPAVTAAFVTGLEVFLLVVDTVWSTMFPLVDLAFRGAVVSVVAVGGVGGYHLALLCVLENLIQAWKRA